MDDQVKLDDSHCHELRVRDCLANKLHSVKPSVMRWESSFHAIRKYEVLLTRLRIGHKRFTHGPLLREDPCIPPECEDCNVQLWSLFHIFIECPFLEHYIGRFCTANIVES